jgi:hypothetical protein
LGRQRHLLQKLAVQTHEQLSAISTALSTAVHITYFQRSNKGLPFEVWEQKLAGHRFENYNSFAAQSLIGLNNNFFSKGKKLHCHHTVLLSKK